MTRDRVLDVLLEALRQALAEPAEQRLYRSGKLAGLFPGRGGIGGEAAARALRDGLLEIIRTEIKGKTVIEWVRLTPRGIELLQEQESPVQVLRQLRALLHNSQQALPAWLEELQRNWQQQLERLLTDAQRWGHQLTVLSGRVEQALARLAPPPPEAAACVAWSGDALAYLDRRQGSGAPGNCPFPELFAALRARCPELTVPLFHDGLRRLSDGKAVRLLPFSGPADQLPAPEYALVQGLDLLYYVTR